MAVNKIKGQNFRAFINDAAVVQATNCQVQITGNMEDASTKDSTSAWNEEQMTSKQWSISVDNVDATVASLRALITMFNSDSQPTVGFDHSTGTQNREAQNAAFARSGNAILNDLNIVANNRETIQVTTQFQGSGPLA